METIKILLVEDNAQLLDIIADYLRQWAGLQVVGRTRWGAEVVRLTRNLRPDVILLDLHLPDKSGLKIVSEVKALLPETSIIAITLFEQNAEREAALAAGADAFILKGNLGDHLLPCLRALQRRQTPKSEMRAAADARS